LFLVPALLTGLASTTVAVDPPSGPEDADLFKGDTADLYFYRNRFFALDMTIPGDWHPLSSKDLLRLLRKESGGDTYSEQRLKEQGTVYLLSIAEYRPAQRGPAGEFNPNITMSAQDLSKLPGIKTTKDYIEWLQSMMKAAGVQSEAAPYPMKLGGVEFWRFDGVTREQETNYWAQIAAVRRGYALTFQLSAGSKTDITRLEGILKSLHFD
jgi:hypothetical protein